MRTKELALITGVLCALPAVVDAQNQRPLRVLVASAAAGPADVQARLLVPKMSEALARTLIVDNRASNNGVFATEICAKAAPDGSTVCVGNSGTHAVNATLYQKLSVLSTASS